jgi:putative Mn2+ efflux pump MntP
MEYLLIFIGISVEAFAIMQIEGAMIAKVVKRALVIACAVVMSIQLLFFFGGYEICSVLAEHDFLSDRVKDGSIVASFVFIFLGIRMVYKSLKKDYREEHRKEIKVREYIRAIIVSNFYTFFARCACGLLDTNAVFALGAIIITSIVMVVGGVYTGYRFGLESKTRAFYLGALVFWIAGLDLIVRNVLGVMV